MKNSRRIVLTGASRGIGRAFALHMAGKGHEVLAISRNEELLKELWKESGQNERLHLLTMDITTSLQPVVDFVRDEWDGRCDVLVNNAGAIVNESFRDINPAEVERVFRTNVYAPFELIRQLLPALEDGHVVNISSMGGVAGSQKFPGLSAYSASKGALNILTECLQAEMEDRCSFNALALGAVQTEMLERAFPGFRAPLQPSELAEFLEFFCLRGQNFFRGKVLPVAVTTP